MSEKFLKISSTSDPSTSNMSNQLNDIDDRYSLTITLESDDKKRSISPVNSIQKDFYAYQTGLFIATQIGYLPVAGSMLSTTFFEPSIEECNLNLSYFNSLLVEWGEHCKESSLPTIFSSTVMLGGVIGSFLSGFLADKFGRKPIVVGCMMILCLLNLLIVCIGNLSIIINLIIFCILGSASGGYMVTNLVLIVENLEKSSSRLLVVSLNGWSLGMCYVAFIGYITQNWRLYHIIMSITAAILFIILHCISLESVRWLTHQNYLGKADKVQLKIDCRNLKVNGLLPRVFQSQDIEKKPPSLLNESIQSTTIKSNPKRYNYMDLFKYKSVRIPLLALIYCFTSSSIVSFGFYFSVEILPGSRYFNLASMGLLKFVLGFIPYLVSYFLGRKPVIVISVGVACISAWLYVTLSIDANYSKNVIITVLGILVTASMDPTWKIIHLYSAELFPTVVRNMARGICNVGARTGSLAAPLIVYSRYWFNNGPIIIFSLLLTIQWIIVVIVLPETKDKILPDKIIEEEENEINNNINNNSNNC